LGELADFRRVYERPMTAANKKNASKEEKERGRVQSKALDQITKTFVLRRLQKDVLKSLLPPRMELLMFCRLSSKQRELYREIADRAAKSIESIGGRDENPLMLLTDLRKLCTHPQLLDQESSAGSDAALSGKMLVLDALLESIRQHSPTDKVVIISNFTSALSVVESSILRKKNLPFVRLDGTVELSARQPIVDSFNSSSINHSLVFLLSSKAGGCGLNLFGANRLIMLDGEYSLVIWLQN
jgi:SNF2 family DNA or RNA helicase